MTDSSFEEQAKGLMKEADVKVDVKVIYSGKLRRYAHLNFWQHLGVKGLASSNAKDALKVGRGIFQSMSLLRKYKPDLVFCKGGYVCLPVGYAARLLRIPLVIHDSDTKAGLTNKVLSKWAQKIATGAPLENYNYPPRKSVYTGVPIAPNFVPYDSKKQAEAKKSLGFNPDKPLVVATGGGLGAKSINHAMLSGAEMMLEAGISVYHIAGKANYDASKELAPDDKNYQLVAFVFKDMDRVLGAADLVVARGSATFLQEMAGMAKPVIVVPGRHLGDQIKNARMFSKAGAAVVMSDDEIEVPGVLAGEIISLVEDPAKRKRLSMNLYDFAKPDAAKDLAKIIVNVAK